MKSIKNSAIFLLLYILPKNLLSSIIGRLANIHWPKGMMLLINRSFVRVFNIDLKEAEKPLEDYRSLQELFIRRLKPGLRTIAQGDNVCSPCDGTVSISGHIIDGMLIQVKGRMYSLKNLLQDQEIAKNFLGGFYATIYLSPKDYHRFHMPMEGQIEKTIYIPGSLWPVNRWAVNNIHELFCQNERMVSLIKPKHRQGMIAHIAVGATMVGKIELDYGNFSHKKSKDKTVWEHKQAIYLKKGMELGKFMFGSTIILLFSPGLINGFTKETPHPIKVNEILAH